MVCGQSAGTHKARCKGARRACGRDDGTIVTVHVTTDPAALHLSAERRLISNVDLERSLQVS
jgi:hypothetical protein